MINALREAQRIHKELVEKLAKKSGPTIIQYHWELLLEDPETLNSNDERDNNIFCFSRSITSRR